jgi:hypothetical protein
MMKGLRWRLIAVYAGVLVVGWIAQALAFVGLSAVGYRWLTEAGFSVTLLTTGVAAVVSVPSQIVFASAFLQARRIADGPTAGELTDVFG